MSCKLRTIAQAGIIASILQLAFAIGPMGRSKPKHKTMPDVAPSRSANKGTPGSSNCTTRWYTQTIDHFSWISPPMGSYTYQQRYLTYDGFYTPGSAKAVFFYAGNEADVSLYADHSGLIWENAAAFGAYIVFAEHRYYGPSQPFGSASMQYPQYLTHEQAMADYATLARYIMTTELNVDLPVILFGGSYGGMLAAWTRTKYPGVFAGAVAASAPIRAFQGMTPAIGDYQRYWQVVTRDATPAAGSAPSCAANVQAAFTALWAEFSSPAGMVRMSSVFDLCTPLVTWDDVNALAFFQMGSWDTMAMGNFPYPSNYLTGGGTAPDLPAWPVRVSCDIMAAANASDPWSLMAALNAASGVFNNATENVECYVPPSGEAIWEDAVWDIQWCTELLPEETYFGRNGAYPAPGGDMFWPFDWSEANVTKHCLANFGYTPRFDWISTSYGPTGLGATNIVFSNGEYDPWSFGGLNVSTPDLPVVWIGEGAHHLDLFFSNPSDPATVTAARLAEIGYVSQWVEAWHAAHASNLAST